VGSSTILAVTKEKVMEKRIRYKGRGIQIKWGKIIDKRPHYLYARGYVVDDNGTTIICVLPQCIDPALALNKETETLSALVSAVEREAKSAIDDAL
jgi:hypothetical protein